MLSVGEDWTSVPAASQADIRTTERRAFPVWAITIITHAFVLVVAGVGDCAHTHTRWLAASSQPQIADQSVAVEQENSPINNEIPDPSSPATESEWRTLNFNIPNESLWSQSEEGSYTALNQTAETAFSWLDEIIDGDFILIEDIISPDDSAIYPINCSILVYGGCQGFSYGNLGFTVGSEFFAIEKHLPWHEVENWLAIYDSHLVFQDQTHQVMIEVIDDQASLYADNRKVASTLIDDEINRSGGIALEKFWEVPAEITFPNIQIKTLNNVEKIFQFIMQRPMSPRVDLLRAPEIADPMSSRSSTAESR